MKNNKKYIILLYLIILVLVGVNIISNRNLIFDNNKIILKNMDESAQIADKEKAIDDLNTSQTQYSNYINTSKTNLAKAITNAGVSTNGTDSLETMITNVSKILSTKTNDATASADSILSGKTAYVKGNKVTGTMTNKGAVTSSINAGGSYTIPKGYHNGSGKVTANSLASQTEATATADNITAGKTAWVDGKLITGNGADNTAYYENGYDVGNKSGSLRQRFTTTPNINYYEHTSYSFENPGFTKLTINSCGANYWWLYSTTELTHTWSSAPSGTQIGSRCDTVFDITGCKYLLLLVQCSQNNNAGHSVCDFTMSY